MKPIIQQYKDEQLTTWKSKEFDKNLGKEIYKYLYKGFNYRSKRLWKTTN